MCSSLVPGTLQELNKSLFVDEGCTSLPPTPISSSLGGESGGSEDGNSELGRKTR